MNIETRLLSYSSTNPALKFIISNYYIYKFACSHLIKIGVLVGRRSLSTAARPQSDEDDTPKSDIVHFFSHLMS